MSVFQRVAGAVKLVNAAVFKTASLPGLRVRAPPPAPDYLTRPCGVVLRECADHAVWLLYSRSIRSTSSFGTFIRRPSSDLHLSMLGSLSAIQITPFLFRARGRSTNVTSPYASAFTFAISSAYVTRRPTIELSTDANGPDRYVSAD